MTLLLTVEEAAAELHIARRRVFALIADGSLPSVRIGRSRRIRSADLAAYIDSLGGQGVAPKPTAPTPTAKRKMDPAVATARARLASLTARRADASMIGAARADLAEAKAMAAIRSGGPLTAKARARIAAALLRPEDREAATLAELTRLSEELGEDDLTPDEVVRLIKEVRAERASN